MVAADPAEGFAELRWIEYSDLAAGGAQRSPKCVSRLAEAADPIDDHCDQNPSLGALGQRIAKLAPDRIIPDDVILQQHSPAGSADRPQPSAEMRGAVDQQFDCVAPQQRSTGGAAQCLLREQPVGSGAGARHARGVLNVHRAKFTLMAAWAHLVSRPARVYPPINAPAAPSVRPISCPQQLKPLIDPARDSTRHDFYGEAKAS